MRMWNIVVGVVVSAVGCIETEYINDPVLTPGVQRLVVSPASSALQVGESVQLQALFVGGNSSGDPFPAAQWASSDSTVVLVDAHGLAVGRNIGQAKITARANSLVSDVALVNVVADSHQLARVVITPSSVQKAIGETQQFSATAYTLNGEIITGRLTSWTSSNSNVVAINASGIATANSNGSASIMATIDGIESTPAQFTVAANSRAGSFVMRPNSGHDVRGTATLSQQANGSLSLMFGNDFASAGGPDVRVYLSRTNSVGAGSIDLGRLLRYTGAQTYSVPSGVQLHAYDWVVIHCVPFNITFGYARLSP